MFVDQLPLRWKRLKADASKYSAIDRLVSRFAQIEHLRFDLHSWRNYLRLHEGNEADGSLKIVHLDVSFAFCGENEIAWDNSSSVFFGEKTAYSINRQVRRHFCWYCSLISLSKRPSEVHIRGHVHDQVGTLSNRPGLAPRPNGLQIRSRVFCLT